MMEALAATPCVPGVLRRRHSLALTHLRALETWTAIAEVPIASWPSLRHQVLQEFPHKARSLAR